MSIRSVLLTTLTILSLNIGAAQATTVINGGFEETPGNPTGAFGDKLGSLASGSGNGSWDVYKTIPGWKTASGAGIEIQTNNTLGSIDAHSGKHYVELDSHGRHSNSTMQQVINLAAGQYRLSFYFSPRTANAKSNGIAYSITDFLCDTLVSGAITGPGKDTAVGTWTLVTALFTVKEGGSKVKLAFSATGKQDTYGGLIDDVSISAVPLPPTAILLGSALVGAAAVSRRRRAKANA